MEVPDVNLMSTGEKPRKYSFGVLVVDIIEEITVKPSTEIIPDEYEHENNKTGLEVVICYSSMDEGNMEGLKEALSDLDYKIPDSNIYKISTRELVLSNLKKVAERDFEDKTCFILVFMGIAHDEKKDQFLADEEEDKNTCIDIREVWSLFTSDNCPTLRKKPKIFIFQASPKFDPTQHDGSKIIRKKLSPGDAYDIPAEADMLLIYKKIADPFDRNHFIEQLCNNIHNYGHMDDIIGVVTHAEYKDEIRPIIISTLTRKLYVRANSQRGHHHDLYVNHGEVLKTLQDLNEKIKAIQEQQSALKRRLEQKIIRKWQEPSLASSSAVTPTEGSTPRRGNSPKMQPGGSKNVSRAPSSASSIDSKSKYSQSKKPAKQPWKF